MDFLKEIVKEIGNDFTQLASDIDETETYVDTGSYIFNVLYQGLYLAGYLIIKLPPLLVRDLLERLFSLAVVKNFWILILMVIAYILTLKMLLTSLYYQVVELT